MKTLAVLYISSLLRFCTSQGLYADMIPRQDVENEALGNLFAEYEKSQSFVEKLINQITIHKKQLTASEENFSIFKDALKVYKISSKKFQASCNFTRHNAWEESRHEIFNHCSSTWTHFCRNMNPTLKNQLNGTFSSNQVPDFIPIFNFTMSQENKLKLLQKSNAHGYRHNLRKQKRNMTLIFKSLKSILRKSFIQLQAINSSFNHRPIPQTEESDSYFTKQSQENPQNIWRSLFDRAVSGFTRFRRQQRHVEQQQKFDLSRLSCSNSIEKSVMVCLRHGGNFFSAAFQKHCQLYNSSMNIIESKLNSLPEASVFVNFSLIIKSMEKYVQNYEWLKNPFQRFRDGKIFTILSITLADQASLENSMIIEIQYPDYTTTKITAGFNTMGKEIAKEILRRIQSA